MELEEMLALARTWRMSAEELEAQRRSFAYGNTKIENKLVTRKMVKQEAERFAGRDF